MPIVTSSDWDKLLSQYPDAHLLQSCAWGELKARFGWEVVRISGKVNAQILFRKLGLGFRMAYLPKGPVETGNQDPFDNQTTDFWHEVDQACHRKLAVFLKVEPDAFLDPGLQMGKSARDYAGIWQYPQGFCPNGFRSSPHAIQPPRTILVDLRGDEDQILARMKQKTRYNIKLAARRGVIIHPSADLEQFHNILRTTGTRDSFGVHSLEYYRSCYELFHSPGACELLVAEYEAQPLAALMVFARGKRAWYFYGASANEHRDLMPSYLLQWEAMRWARLQGCLEYDLWGIPDANEGELEASFNSRSDDLWGVYRFKRGFGGCVVRSAGPWDRVYHPLAYQAYQLWVRYTQRGLRP